jgi:hypothetical protein
MTALFTILGWLVVVVASVMVMLRGAVFIFIDWAWEQRREVNIKPVIVFLIGLGLAWVAIKTSPFNPITLHR